MTNSEIMIIIKLVKKLLVSASGLFTYLSSPLVAFAQSISPVSIDPCTGANGTADIICKLGGNNIANTIRNIIVFFVMLAVIIALVYLLYGGIKWITSGGEKEKVEESRRHIIAALIGLIVVVLAVFLLSVILAAFGISFSSLQIPIIGSGAK